MSAFPTLRRGAVAMYPLSRSVEWRTQVVTFTNDSEQRWASRGGALARFTLQFTNLSDDDLNTVLAFLRTLKGDFTEFSITIDGVTYDHLFLDENSITWTENKPDHYTFSLRIRQWRV